MPTSIAIVEDDKSLSEFMSDYLRDMGYSVRVFDDGIRAIKDIIGTPPDLVVLDLMLPNLRGENVCVEIKKIHPSLPIIILTGKTTKNDIVEGLNLGADDYIAKPFDIDELVARIKARLRSARVENKSVLKVNDLVLNTNTMEVTRDGKSIRLTPQEFKLLEYLMINENRVLSRDMILNRIWSYAPNIETRVVDVYVGYLRKKIDRDFKKPLLHSIRGFGYTIRD